MNVILNALVVLMSISGSMTSIKIQNKESETSFTSDVLESEHEHAQVVTEEYASTQSGKTFVVCPICGQLYEEGDASTLGPRWGSFAIVAGVMTTVTIIGVAGALRKRKLK